MASYRRRRSVESPGWCFEQLDRLVSRDVDRPPVRALVMPNGLALYGDGLQFRNAVAVDELFRKGRSGQITRVK